MDLNYEGLTAWHLIAAAPKDSMQMDYYIPVFLSRDISSVAHMTNHRDEA